MYVNGKMKLFQEQREGIKENDEGSFKYDIFDIL
jgi:hypothetical protein